jgi:Flp pilus assembly protein TadD
MEQAGAKSAAAVAYTAALKRWPQSLPALIGLGNARYAVGNIAGAEEAFRRALKHHPNSLAAQNNLAQTLLEQRRFDEAETTARRALDLATDKPELGAIRETLEEITRRRATP